MGHRLESFDFAPVCPGPRPERYPWREWTDGSIWQVRRGQDYVIATRHLQAALHGRAARDGVRVQTRRVGDGASEGLVFRFVAADEEASEW